MKYLKYIGLAAFVAGTVIFAYKKAHTPNTQQPIDSHITQVFSTKKQLTGIAISQEGRMFINFPLWYRPYKYAVVEINKNGKLEPYPDKNRTKWKPGRDPSKHFVCVQSVYIDKKNYLWILDAAAPGMTMAIKGGPKLVKIDLKTNQVIQVIQFDEWTAPERSYLNDVRIDIQTNYAYITDSNLGAIIVVNLNNGQTKRLLANHPSTKAEPGLLLKAEFRNMQDKLGYVPQIHSDGIELDTENKYLYYHALTANNLYRIDTRYLRNFNLSEKEVEKHVELVANTGPTDGMIMDNSCKIYLSSFPDNSVKCYNLNTGQLELVARDSNLIWPDTFAWGSDGALYVTSSQVNKMPVYNQGKPDQPYKIFRIDMQRSSAKTN